MNTGRVVRRSLELSAEVSAMVAALALAVSPGIAVAQSRTAGTNGGYEAETAAQLVQLGQQRGWSAARLYDLANLYARQGALGAAILGYERAQLLAPRDPDIAANLALVREQAGLQPQSRPWLQSAARSLSLQGWTGLAIVTLWLLCGALAVLALSKRRRRLWIGCSLAVLLGGLVSAAGFASRDAELRTDVVTAKGGTDLRLSPFEGAASQGQLREGESLRADARHGAYLHVRDDLGQQGWVDSAAVESLMPGAS